MSHQVRGPGYTGPDPSQQQPSNLAAQWYYDDFGSDEMSTRSILLIGVAIVLLGIIVLIHRDTIFPQVEAGAKLLVDTVNEKIGNRNAKGWTFGHVVLVAVVMAFAIVALTLLGVLYTNTGWGKKRAATDRARQLIGAINIQQEQIAWELYQKDPRNTEQYSTARIFVKNAPADVYEHYMEEAKKSSKGLEQLRVSMLALEKIISSWTFLMVEVDEKKVKEALTYLDSALPDPADKDALNTWIQKARSKEVRNTIHHALEALRQSKTPFITRENSKGNSIQSKVEKYLTNKKLTERSPQEIYEFAKTIR